MILLSHLKIKSLLLMIWKVGEDKRNGNLNLLTGFKKLILVKLKFNLSPSIATNNNIIIKRIDK